MKVNPISAKGRGRISTLLCLLSWTECGLGLALAADAARPLTIMSTYMKGIKLNLDMIFKTQMLCGLTVALASFGGTLVTRAVAENPLKFSIRRSYIMWTTLSSTLIILVIIVLFSLPHAVDTGIAELSYIFQRGMRDYLQERRWKSMLDGIQQNYKCCGDQSYEDWFKTNWMPVQSIRTDLKTDKSPVREDGGLLVLILPYSCCKPEANIPCLHDNLQQNSTFSEWVTGDVSRSQIPTPFRDSVHTRGCRPVFENTIMAGLTSFTIIIVMIIIIQTGVLILTKILRDSLIRRDSASKEVQVTEELLDES